MSKGVYVMGDVHGDFRPIRAFHERHKNNPVYQEQQEKVLIMLGDFGANFFFNHRDEGFKKKLGSYPFIYFVIRGNHEERPSICAEKYPDKWHTEVFWGNAVYVENEYPYIKYALDDLNIYKIQTEYGRSLTTLIIPGAYSVDKYRRLEAGWSWFPHEQLDEVERIKGLRLLEFQGWNVDLVLSHTCPIIYEPTDLFLPIVDQSMVDKTMERYLGEIEYHLCYKTWLWGHYHEFRDYPRPDGRIRTMLYNDAVINLDTHMKGDIEKL